MTRNTFPTFSTRTWLYAIGGLVSWLVTVALTASIAYAALESRLTEVEVRGRISYEWLVRVEGKLDGLIRDLQQARPLFPAPSLIPPTPIP